MIFLIKTSSNASHLARNGFIYMYVSGFLKVVFFCIIFLMGYALFLIFFDSVYLSETAHA